MKLQAIVLDIDGTLLTSEKKIATETYDMLIAAQEKGVRVVLASGRPTTGVWPLAKQLKMDQYHGLIVSYNGAKVTDCTTQEDVYEKLMTAEESKRVLSHLQKFNVVVMTDNKGYMFCRDAYDAFVDWDGRMVNIVQYESRGGNFKVCEVGDLAEFCDFETAKITAAGDNTYITERIPEIYGPFEEELNAMFTSKFYYEFTAKGVDKAQALAHAFEKLGIKEENVIAFGDGHNDVTMIQYAGLGVAMANAEEALLKVADEVTSSNDENGVAIVLKRYL